MQRVGDERELEMKVLIVSDTHGHDRNLERILEKVSPIDVLLHAGDAEGHEDYIQTIAGCPVHIVAGNNDFFSDLSREEEFSLEHVRIFLTHGHNYGVSMELEHIEEEGRARGADIVVFGHTHKPVVIEKEGITLINPGSLSFPRQMGRNPSFVLMETDRWGKFHFTINYLK